MGNALLVEWRTKDTASGIEVVVGYQGKPVRGIDTAWANALKKAGMDRHIGPYDLRHAFATKAVAAGVDFGDVAALGQRPLVGAGALSTGQRRSEKAAIAAIVTRAQRKISSLLAPDKNKGLCFYT